jgi:hypothetical protein
MINIYIHLIFGSLSGGVGGNVYQKFSYGYSLCIEYAEVVLL